MNVSTAAEPAPSRLFPVAAFIASSFVAAYFVASFAQPSLSAPVQATTLLCWGAALATLLLLPVDTASDAFDIAWFWRAIYLLALLLGWVGSETMCRSLEAGEFSSFGRVRAAMHASLRLYVLVVMLLLVALSYQLLHCGVSISLMQDAVHLLINAQGVVFLAAFQGFGLVELPRSVWRQAAPRNKLSSLCYR